MAQRPTKYYTPTTEASLIPKFTMNPRILFFFIAALFTKSLSIEIDPRPISNVTVIGTVFCDACSNNTFSKHSYFLQGAKVLVQCNFKANSTSREEISISVERITDRFGVYKVDIPPVDGFECREGHEIESFCRASLIGSSSSLCNVPGVRSSTEHVAIKCSQANLCIYNLNALNYRPGKRDLSLCGTKRETLSRSLNSSLFFWPPFPPFGLPWPNFPPLPSLPFPFPFPPIPFPSPPSFPFPFPPWFPFPKSPSFPFPFTPTPNPPAFPFPFPPFPFPFPPFPPTPSLFPPSPPPPSFPFPFPFPPFPPQSPTPFLFAPPPPPPTPSFPFPFPPIPPVIPSPVLPSPPPPPLFSLRDPRSWYPFQPPPSPNQPQNQHP